MDIRGIEDTDIRGVEEVRDDTGRDCGTEARVLHRLIGLDAPAVAGWPFDPSFVEFRFSLTFDNAFRIDPFRGAVRSTVVGTLDREEFEDAVVDRRTGIVSFCASSSTMFLSSSFSNIPSGTGGMS